MLSRRVPPPGIPAEAKGSSCALPGPSFRFPSAFPAVPASDLCCPAAAVLDPAFAAGAPAASGRACHLRAVPKPTPRTDTAPPSWPQRKPNEASVSPCLPRSSVSSFPRPFTVKPCPYPHPGRARSVLSLRYCRDPKWFPTGPEVAHSQTAFPGRAPSPHPPVAAGAARVDPSWRFPGTFRRPRAISS